MFKLGYQGRGGMVMSYTGKMSDSMLFLIWQLGELNPRSQEKLGGNLTNNVAGLLADIWLLNVYKKTNWTNIVFLIILNV